MASLTTDARGNRRIMSVDGTDRRTLYLGNIDKTAQGVKLHVERLINAKQFGQPLPVETAGWVASISDALNDRLVNVGLTSSRAAPHVVTLAEVMDTYAAK